MCRLPMTLVMVLTARNHPPSTDPARRSKLDIPAEFRHDLSAMPQPPQPGEAQQPNIVIPPDVFEGHWANVAQLQRTPHEFTLDFVRVGPQGQFGTVVSRINFSPLLLAQLVEVFNTAWRQYTEEAGMPGGDD